MGLITAFTVYGQARPQGSTKTITRPVLDSVTKKPKRDPQTGQIMMRSVITHSNRAGVMEWRTDIRAAVQLHAPQFKAALVMVPVGVVAMFWRPRGSAPKRAQFPKTSPDLDKLLRATGDALSGVIVQDDRLIKVWYAAERYTDGAARMELAIWTADSLPLAAPGRKVNPLDQLSLFDRLAKGVQPYAHHK